MRSIYERALGTEFAKLHPQIQRRFGFDSRSGTASIGRGVMQKLWHGPFYTLPFLYLGSFRRIMFPEQGSNVPFSIRNYAYVDAFGRETVTWIRDFKTATPRRFDAYMIYSKQRGCIVDYLGTHQHLAVDIKLSVDGRGGLNLESGEQRFYEGRAAFQFPMSFSGKANVTEWFDDGDNKFHIEVNVANSVWGPLFGYKGWFDVEWLHGEAAFPPDDVKPRRCEKRE